METYYFSENPYPYLPAEETYDSIRATLPNRAFDPVLGAKLYQRYFDEWQVADELGLNLMTNEHHQTPTCLHPSVAISSAILARITKNARITVLGNPLPMRRDPIRIAEEMAVVDTISFGRLNVGFVKGQPYEVLPANAPTIGISERLWEAHDLILKAWTSHDGPFNWEGTWHYRNVNIWPRPYQQPHPPIWMTTSTVGSMARIARHGYVVGTFVGGFEHTKALFGAYRKTYQETFGVSETPDDRLAYAALVAVADSTEAGMERLRTMQWYFDSGKVARHIAQPPGYVPPQAFLSAARSGPPKSGPGAARGKPAEWLVENGMAFAGTPDDVVAQMTRFYAEVGGFGNLMMMGQAGRLGHEETVNSLELYAREVAPRLSELNHSLVKA
ncbi:LLM class flavin-dependent oxidoreductase [Dactylosporangium fulvum]|uniref:LLM class flavin-dependent oxidoreductase n=1 Tax=Dactylosporangium fulvum TaxID=53359 RepID=A0ABY5VT08_9ACTN|nr:LLM class flavin-dependent oxidoreductase [Dactylosporangium fulvum]UWP80241.1 LLM class flavin-dependent oxidoreductase [Dactylosporangium fulvum]